LARLTILTVTILGFGCESSPPRAEQTTASGASQPPASAKITRIVFVGKSKACDCTRKRIDDSYAGLQQALSETKGVTVQRLRVDTDEAQIAPYKKLRPIMVLPGVYFLSDTGALVAMLQGEISAEQFSEELLNNSN